MIIKPNVPVIYEGMVPKGFRNEVLGWGSYPKEELEKNKGKLLTLDIDFGDVCSLNCPHCFRKENRVDVNKNRTMGYDDIITVIRDGKKLGLRTVKFLGAGEPFEDPRFLEFLRELERMGIASAIFTKGHVLGDDRLVEKLYSRYGIHTGKELVEELAGFDASILLGFNSFDTEIQDKMAGNVKGYTLKRNRALELLTDAGFNRHNPTKICLAINPITKENYGEALEIYKWARARNFYVIACPTMVSGRCADPTSWRNITPSHERLVDLYVKIYRFNIDNGIQTLKQIEKEGISAYAGGHPCNQVSCGMYVTLSGTVLRCPGDDVTIFGNIFDQPLKDIWVNSENFKRSGTFNCFCPPKEGKTMSAAFYSDVLARLKG